MVVARTLPRAHCRVGRLDQGENTATYHPVDRVRRRTPSLPPPAVVVCRTVDRPRAGHHRNPRTTLPAAQRYSGRRVPQVVQHHSHHAGDVMHPLQSGSGAAARLILRARRPRSASPPPSTRSPNIVRPSDHRMRSTRLLQLTDLATSSTPAGMSTTPPNRSTRATPTLQRHYLPPRSRPTALQHGSPGSITVLISATSPAAVVARCAGCGAIAAGRPRWSRNPRANDRCSTAELQQYR